MQFNCIVSYLLKQAGFFVSVQATDKDWAQLQGKFLLNGSPARVVIYLEGPPAGTDILVNSLVVSHAEKVSPSPPPVIEVGQLNCKGHFIYILFFAIIFLVLAS